MHRTQFSQEVKKFDKGPVNHADYLEGIRLSNSVELHPESIINLVPDISGTSGFSKDPKLKSQLAKSIANVEIQTIRGDKIKSQNWRHKDIEYVTAQEALDYGLIDNIYTEQAKAKVQTIQKTPSQPIKHKTAAKITGKPTTSKDKKDEVDWDLINSLSHNREPENMSSGDGVDWDLIESLEHNREID